VVGFEDLVSAAAVSLSLVESDANRFGLKKSFVFLDDKTYGD
jgi:hypothetical protein